VRDETAESTEGSEETTSDAGDDVAVDAVATDAEDTE
jgi:hypothetical protein